MRIPQNKLQKIKAAIHCAQLLLIFLATCLTLSVMTKRGGYSGQTAYYFALCFITIPAIIYQVLVPMWSRAWRFNNLYAYAVIDILFTHLWFAASIAVAVWNAKGIAKGKTNKSDTKEPSKDNARFLLDRADDIIQDGTCKSFAYGSAVKCSVSKATVGFGIIIFLLFAATTYLSIQSLRQHRQTGAIPNTSFRSKNLNTPENEEEGKVWSTSTDDLNNSHDRLPHGGHGGSSTSDRDGLLGAGPSHSGSGGVVRPEGPESYEELAHQTTAGGMAHPGRRVPSQPITVLKAYAADFAPSALSPPAYVTSPNGSYSALR